jgi:5-methyltetrahydrofolate--homocysteine methyltransferase
MNNYYKHNWGETKSRFEAWWNNDIYDRPILSLNARKDIDIKNAPAWREEEFFNTGAADTRIRLDFSNVNFDSDSYPEIRAIPGLNNLAVYAGGKPVFSPDTVWLHQFIDDIEKFNGFNYNPGNQWYQKHITATRELTAAAKHDYLVDIPELMEAMDILATARGTQELCLDMMDYPEALHRHLEVLYDAWETYFTNFYHLIKDADDGNSVGCFDIWGPGKTYKTQSDFSTLMSPAQFREFSLPTLERQVEFLDFAMYHLDGKLAMLNHLDAVLAVKKLRAVQWSPGIQEPGSGDPCWYPLYQKIRNAGKSLWLHFEDVSADEMIQQTDGIIKAIGPKGLYLKFFKAITEAEQEKIISHANKFWR